MAELMVANRVERLGHCKRHAKLQLGTLTCPLAVDHGLEL